MHQNSDMAKTTDPKTFGERLKWARKEKRLPQKVVEERIHIPQSTLSELENDKSDASTWTPLLARLYGVNAGWLADGRGSPALSAPNTIDQPLDNAHNASRGVRRYPVLSYIQAGHPTDIEDPYPPQEGFDVEYGDNDASDSAFFLEIEGDSMLPDFKEGDRVRIDPDVAPWPGCCVVAIDSGRKATFKKYRVRGVDANGVEIFELAPLNPDYPILRSDETPLRILGTMTEHRRKYRRGK